MNTADADRVRATKRLPEAMEGAFILVMAQNALLLSRPLVDLGKGHLVQAIHGIIIAVAVTNFIMIAINWIGAKTIGKSEVVYSTRHLFWDIMILAVFFLLTQTLVDLCGNDFAISTSSALTITGGAYLVLNLLFLAWNNIEIRTLLSGEMKGKALAETVGYIKQLNVLNALCAVLDAVLIGVSAAVGDPLILSAVFVVWMLGRVAHIWLHLRKGVLAVATR